MYHPLPREWLLATVKVQVGFSSGAEKQFRKGSGFLVSVEDEILLVTNRHVIDLEYSDQNFRGKGYELSTIVMSTFEGSERYVTHIGEADVSWHSDSRVDIAFLKNMKAIGVRGRLTFVPTEIIGDENYLEKDLGWGDQVSFSSFQAWTSTESEYPIVRTGIVSSDPVSGYVFEGTRVRDIFLLEAFSFKGSSGSPVFANAKGIKVGPTFTGGGFRPAKLIGVMVGRMEIGGGLHPGLSYCHRSDLLLRMIRGDDPLESSRFISSSLRPEQKSVR